MKLTKLKTNILGKNFIYYDEIDSTQDEIWRLIKNKEIKNGTLVFADIQTKGKGTHGRIWHTDEKNNIAFSFYLEMDCDIKKLENLTIDIAEIIVDIFKDLYNINLNIKRPNDIVYNGKKIGGILTQSKMISNKVKYIVVGIGINTSKEHFSEDIANIATSIKKEFGITVNIDNVICEFCNRFEKLIGGKIA